MKIGNLILAAPDIDMEVAIQRFTTKRLSMDIDRVTLYVSDKDRAIGLSDWLFSSGRRLGQIRLEDIPPYLKKSLKYMDRTHIIDAKVKTNFTGHNYFHASPAVSSDLILMLRDNRDPGQANGRPLIKVDPEVNFWQISDGYPNKLVE